MRFCSYSRIITYSILAVMLAGTLTAGNRSGKNYYVASTGNDANDGSQRRPWATITQAAKRIGPGDTVHVGSGTYTSPVTTEVSGLPDARIRFVASRPSEARISIVKRADFAWINTGSCVDIEGFEVTGDAANGIYSLGAFSRILNNHVHHLIASCDGNGGSGINLGPGALHSTVSGNVVHDVRAVPTCDRPHGVGVYVQSTADAVYHNLVYLNGNQGIQMWHGASKGLIAHNTVFNNGKEGILIGCGDNGCVQNDDTIVVNNITVYNAAGIREYGLTGRNNVYRNNLVFGNQRDVLLQNGIVATGTLQADPSQLFMNWRADGSGDYRLRPDAPATHAGSTQRFPAPFETIDASPVIGADPKYLVRTP